jgi:hypothetical protein
MEDTHGRLAPKGGRRVAFGVTGPGRVLEEMNLTPSLRSFIWTAARSPTSVWNSTGRDAAGNQKGDWRGHAPPTTQREPADMQAGLN